ncbi:MAG: hypothetical protein HS108_01840 [Planctomycetes bacterium]|jgi:hypothetical protein|nr:hypothetical protein [Planctomycetota bacterium]MCL4731245.1 hypothetical protein [Planctomycetota bacterium]
MRRLLPLFVLLLMLPGCPGDDKKSAPPSPGLHPVYVIGPDGGTANPDGGAPVALTISGQVTFDRLPVTAAGLGATPAVTPAAGVLVEAVRHNDIFAVVATTTTDAGGNYTLNLNVDHDFYVRARAQAGAAGNLDRVYHPRTVPAITHAVTGPILNRAAGSQNADLHAGFALPANRAGAFAALDTVRRLRQSVSGSFAALGHLDVFWCTGAATPTGTDEVGPNGRPAIYLLGGTETSPATTDHDEYDETVIAHEWASFLQLTQSRDNNFGGFHGGEELIYTASYSEGVVTAIGCALLGQRLYRDTVGYPTGSTGVQFEFDCESGVLPGTGAGYASEFEVTRAVWDLLDGATGWPADTDGDPVAIAPTDFFASFAALSARPAPYEICWLASLLQQLVDDGHLTVTDADTVMTAHGAQFPPAGGADPFPPPLVVGGPAATGTLDAWGGTNPNPVLGPGANAVFRVTLAAPATLQLNLSTTTAGYTPAAHRLELSLHDLERNILGLAGGNGAAKGLSLTLPAGTYLVRVQHRPDSSVSSQPSEYSITAQ